MSTKEGIRYALIDLMDESNTSGTDLAEAIGVTKQAVSAWRTGKASIGVDNIPAICEYFGIEIGDFFNRSNNLEHQMQIELTSGERTLVELFRRLPKAGQHAVLSGLEDYVKSQR